MALINGQEFCFHHNVLITNNTTFEDYYKKVKDIITQNYDEGYPVDVIPSFKVMVWNMDNVKNKRIKITKNTTTNNKFNLLVNNRKFHSSSAGCNSIKPLKDEILGALDSFASMDIETINYNDIQIPVAISFSSDHLNKLFLIKLPQIINNININKSVDVLWLEFFTFINRNPFATIFVHNLGSFDGYFLYKAISNHFNPDVVSTIIDNHNKFISISIKLANGKITWKDSYRIFPVSLDNLCGVFNVPGKSSIYNQKFNDLSLFNDNELLEEFKTYSLQDSIALYNVLDKAQELYASEYNIDLTSILSTSTLSLKIFRQKYLNFNIPILKGSVDRFIRNSYFGGHTDYYKAYISEGYYYDVNSLYPFAMCKPMPFELIKEYKDMTNINLSNFFGFCLAEITTPRDILKPLLPYKYQGKTIYPTGNWIGVYFSEELKAIEGYGYKINLILKSKR